MNKWIKQTAAALTASGLLIITAGFGLSAATAKAPDDIAANLPLYELGTLAGGSGPGLADGGNAAALFRYPASLAVRDDGELIVSDSGNQRIRTIKDGAVTTAAGADLGMDAYGSRIGSMLDGSGERAAFNGLAGLAADARGRIIAADSKNHAIRMLEPDGSVVTVAGTGVLGFRDGAASQARFFNPLDIAVTKDGVIYVADTLNHVIRKIEDGRVTTLTSVSKRVVEYFPGAVSSAGDYADGPIGQAKFNEPSGLALDAKGNLYVSDTGNHRIRYIDFGSGTVTTVAGNPELIYSADGMYAEGGFMDGPAGTASFHAPLGLTVTPDGGLLVADSLNHAIRYMKNGIVKTLAGTPGEAGAIDGPAAYGLLHNPADVISLDDGKFAIADTGNSQIRLIEPYIYPAGLKADGKIRIVFGQDILSSDAEPQIIRGVTFVPVRVIGERLGYTVRYDKKNQQVSLEKSGLTYTMMNGSNSVMLVNGEDSRTMQLPEAPFIHKGRTYLPIRFLAEKIGLDVQWLADVKAVLLRSRR
ncbi:stalk domain-containing protein [Paenibacillus tarimensis]|uniref:stalk domain-containing protein n=1 Tax=Paenibacillus tarimensis TaxID=416012 RepID=UPI001EEC9202|nr:stalk domain-containing protein [Paenibacillus tarimensis]MCF2943244.1 copper amine oxidase [Paenibacillus tarimensis]